MVWPGRITYLSGAINMSILASLQAEHDAFFRAADRWRDGELADEDLVEFLEGMARVHFRDEEEILYPALADAVPTSRLDSYRQAHREAVARLAAIREALAAGQPPAGQIKQVIEDVSAHARSEEDSLFPAAAERLGPEKLRDLQRRRHECACGGQ